MADHPVAAAAGFVSFPLASLSADAARQDERGQGRRRTDEYGDSHGPDDGDRASEQEGARERSDGPSPLKPCDGRVGRSALKP